MKVFFDTSVLVAAIVAAHPQHERAFPWLKRARAAEFDYLAAAHSVAETYAVLSRLPVSPRIAPGTAWRLVRENLTEPARIVALSPSDYAEVLRRAAEHGLAGGAVYDALIARAAQKAGADRLLTFNLRHFERAWPDGRDILAEP